MTPKLDSTSWCFHWPWVFHNILACLDFPNLISASLHSSSALRLLSPRDSKPQQLSGNRCSFPISQTWKPRLTRTMQLVRDKTRTWIKPFMTFPGAVLSLLHTVEREKEDTSCERLCFRPYGSHFSPVTSLTTLEGNTSPSLWRRKAKPKRV